MSGDKWVDDQDRHMQQGKAAGGRQLRVRADRGEDERVVAWRRVLTRRESGNIHKEAGIRR